MENKKEIRWKQRFSNLEKAFLQLKSAIDQFEKLNDLSKEGLIQRFEYTYELSWKTLKDYLESKGEQEKFQRDILRKAFNLEIIDNGELWLEMLEKRNLMSHTYDKATFKTVVNDIYTKYYFEIEKLYHFLKNENE